MGAMRLPQSHKPVHELITYVNEKLKEKKHPQIEVIPYIYHSRRPSEYDFNAKKWLKDEDHLSVQDIYYNRARKSVSLNNPDDEAYTPELANFYAKMMEDLSAVTADIIRNQIKPELNPEEEKIFEEYVALFESMTMRDLLLFEDKKNQIRDFIKKYADSHKDVHVDTTKWNPKPYTVREALKCETYGSGTNDFNISLIEIVLDDV